MDRFRNPANQLFDLARQGKRVTRWWAVPLLLYLFLFAGIPGSLIPFESASESGLWQSALESTGFLVAAYAPIALLIGIWIWKWEGRRPTTVGLRQRDALRNIGYGFALGAILIGVGVSLLLTSGSDTSIQFDQSTSRGWVAIAPGLLVLTGWCIQGLTEEMAFRGWMLQAFGLRFGPIIGAAAATGIFTLAHLDNPGMSWLGALNLALIGVLFVLITLLEGGIWAASGFHIAWNWAQSNIFGFRVSGLDVGGGSLVQIVPDETNRLTGGEFGFEGSVAATTCIVVGIIIVLAIASRQQQPARRTALQ